MNEPRTVRSSTLNIRLDPDRFETEGGPYVDQYEPGIGEIDLYSVSFTTNDQQTGLVGVHINDEWVMSIHHLHLAQVLQEGLRFLMNTDFPPDELEQHKETEQ